MSKKTSGLGKGLEDLLTDNAPQIKHSGPVILHDGNKDVSISPERQETAKIISAVAHDSTVSETVKPETVTVNTVENDKTTETVILHGGASASTLIKSEELPRSRSLKALFRSYNK